MLTSLKQSIVVLSMLFAVVACNKGCRLKVITTDIVIDRHGRAESCTHFPEKPKVINYFSLNGFCECLSRSPKRKIDDIIDKNPGWDFYFFVVCKVVDTTIVRSRLNKYDCDFQVYIDTSDVFWRENFHEQGHYSEIGYITDVDNTIIGVSTIGDSQSFFDSMFRRVGGVI